MAWTLARRGLDWRFRGLRLLIVCLVLGTAALSAIGTLTGGIGRELAARGQAMLGGDLELTLAGREAAADELAAMQALGTVSQGTRLQAMARRGDDAAPVELKAVDARWPLYGQFKVNGGRVAGAPKGMTAWIDPGVADRLGVKAGDHLRVGDADLVIGGVIAGEPDRLSEGFALGPTVIVSEAALKASGLVQVGSMARWKYRLRLPKEADAAALADAFKARFVNSGFQVKTRDKASPGLDRFVERMGRFLVLVALAALGIAGIGIAGGVSSYLEMRRASIATLKILGASSGDVVRIFLLQIAAAALAAIALGLALGVGITPLLARALEGLLPIPPGFTVDVGTLAVAGAYGLLIALTFAAPPLLEARRVPAMALLRARVAPVGGGWPKNLWQVPLWVLPVGLGLTGIAALAVLTSPQPWLAAGFLGGAAAVFALLALIGRALSWGAARLPRPSRPLARMALGNLHRPGAQTSALVVALGFALAAFVLLAAVQTSIDANIAKRVPERAPDYFVLDVPRGAGAETFKALVRREAPGAAVRMVPAMRGTVLAYGPEGAMTDVATLKAVPDETWLLRGDRGLTYADEVPPGNTLTAGRWWPKDYKGEPLVSVDADQAGAIGLKVGDKLRISLLGTEREARVASLRRIDWSSFGFNYALVFSPNALEDAPHTYAATITLAAPEKRDAVRRAILSGLVKALPESSVIEVGPVLGQARTLLGQVGTAIFAAAGVAVLAGLAVLAGAIAAARAARQYDSVILRVLGASRGQLLALLAAEYALLCAVLALVALALGGGTAWLVIVELFEFDWAPDWGRVFAVLSGGVALVMVLAVLGSLSVLRTRPAEALRAL
ncbi:ABC transporter permease [Novosphingobium sp. AAP93]|uniref:ABC transporter permease n=1 Tax=Novosphingobium sp. AAP93 TaxID=1523427 RepID=UPI0006B909B7|nr:FtsX-like permease family protein [Novosphingobium sp. AAP93]KPF78242.1 ABC transporter permease [Novosphingobium sp. AAP93]